MDIFRKLTQIFDKKTKLKLLVLLVAIIIGGFLEMLTLSLIQPFISILLDNTIIDTNPLLSWVYELVGLRSAYTFLAFIAFTVAVVFIFRSSYMFILNKVKFKFVARRQANLSVRLLNKIMDYSYLYHTHRNVAELREVVSNDVAIMFALINAVLAILNDSFMSFFILIYLLVMSPLMTLFVVILALLCVLMYFKLFRKVVKKLGQKRRTATIAMTKSSLQAFGAIKEVKVMRREAYFRNRFKINSDEFVDAEARFLTISSAPHLMIEGICFSGAFIILGCVILLGTDVSAMVPQLSMFVLAAFRLLPSIARQVNNVSYILSYRASADAVYRNLFEEVDIAASVDSDLVAPKGNIEVVDAGSGVGAAVSEGLGDIVISDLSFKYPTVPEPVLINVSFSIPTNKSVAFVGTSGQGKTTLADLILGVLSPDTGGVFFEGKSIHSNPDMWSKKVGYIPQSIYLLDESIIENVAFGIDLNLVDEAIVWHALEQAQLREFVESLPEGINTVVGDRGVRLSGGQRQRIGIARALYDDPPILLLDEATSSLDHETERAIIESIKGFHGNKTVIIVAHRLTTIEHCDIVYRVENKSVTRER